jgi:peptidoglycan DL-endopeptidase CwlO
MPVVRLRKMSIRLATGAVAALALCACAIPVTRASPPEELSAKQAKASAVLEEISALDARFERTVENWNRAQIALARSTSRLAATRASLKRARASSHRADEQRAARLVEIYERGSPSDLEVLLGAGGFGESLEAVDFVHSVMAQDLRIADRARAARERLVAVEQRMREEQATRRRTLAGLARSRRHIGVMLAQRRELLRSVEAEIAAIRARQAREQAARRAAARARLERERREAERRARLERQRRAREAAARAKRRATSVQSAPAAAAPAPPPTTTASITAAAAPSPIPTRIPGSPPGGQQVGPPPAAETPGDAAPARIAPDLRPGHPDAASTALAYLGVRYRWGGESPKTGFDCSGLVAYVYAQLGVQLPHSAAAQYALGAPVTPDRLQPGDLVFFNGLSHVGIYIGGGQMVHAPRSGDVVEISPVFEPAEGYVGARRI